VAVRSTVAFTGYIRLRQYRHDAGLFKRRRRVERADERVGVRSANRPRVKKIRVPAAEVVDIQGLASDVAAGAFVWNRRAGDLHSACSHRNFSTSDFATSRRYSFEPR
jgi:hypothetical protein